MTINKFITTDKMVEYLDAELCSLLNAKEVYEVSQYGWLDDDSPDPDYLGHALWQSSSAVNDGCCVSRPAVKRSPGLNIRLREIGADFEGLMKTVRMSIGMSLLHEDVVAGSVCSDDFMFRLHHADAVWKLGMASWKLRDFWLASLECDSESSSQPDSVGRSCAVQYCDPFFNAEEILGEKLAEEQSSLTKFVDSLGPLVAHIASLLTKSVGVAQEADCMDGCREYPAINRRDPSNDLASPAMAVAEVANWYKTLVEASNSMFMIEHFLGAEEDEVVEFGTGQTQHVDRLKFQPKLRFISPEKA